MIELKIWNKARPEGVRVIEHPDAQSAGVFLSGAIQAAVDAGGTLIIEAVERK